MIIKIPVEVAEQADAKQSAIDADVSKLEKLATKKQEQVLPQDRQALLAFLQKFKSL